MLVTIPMFGFAPVAKADANSMARSASHLLLTIILLNIDKTINIAYRTQGNAGGAEWYEFFRLLLFVVVTARDLNGFGASVVHLVQKFF